MIRLSASKLNLLNECPQCFWLANVKKVERPRGIFPSLPGGMDRKLKVHFDKFRGELPPELIGKLPGVLIPDVDKLNKWRNWKTGLTYTDPTLDVTIIGALDDYLLDTNSMAYVPLDYKTKGSEPKTDGSEYYQTQLDTYELLLNVNGYPTCGKAFLIYVWPEEVLLGSYSGYNFRFRFPIGVYEIATSIDRVKTLIAKAVGIIKGNMPESSPSCEQCKYIVKKRSVI